MSQPHDLIVGIIGGMGPEATIDLMARIIELTPATEDSDHIHMLVDNNPKVPSRIDAIVNRAPIDPTPTLIAMAQGLERQGADYLVMPCNTAHAYHEAIAAEISIPFLNLLELTARAAVQKVPGLCKVGLLGSSALGLTKIYESIFANLGVEVCYPDPAQQQDIMHLIKTIKAKKTASDAGLILAKATNQLLAKDVGVIIIACTELSLVTDLLQQHLVTVDAADVLAREVVRRSTRGSASSASEDLSIR
jgi:aspartate racemase